MRRSLAVFATLALVSVALLVTAGCSSNAQRPAPIDMPDEPPPGIFDTPTAAELQDLEAIARTRGLTTEEAATVFGWRRGFSQLAATISAKHPDTFAGAAIEDDGSAWIAFTGEVPEDVAILVARFEGEMMAELSTAIDLIANRGFTEREILERANAAHDAVYGQSPYVSEVVTVPDVRTGEIRMIVRSIDADLVRTEADVRSRVPEGVVVQVTLSPLVIDD